MDKILSQLSQSNFNEMLSYTGGSKNEISLHEFLLHFEETIKHLHPDGVSPQEKAKLFLLKVENPAKTYILSNTNSDERCDIEKIITLVRDRFETNISNILWLSELEKMEPNLLSFADLCDKIELLCHKQISLDFPTIRADTTEYKTVFNSMAYQFVSQKMNRNTFDKYLLYSFSKPGEYISLKNTCLGYEKSEKIAESKRYRMKNGESDKCDIPNINEVPSCNFCQRKGHHIYHCWKKHPHLAPIKNGDFGGIKNKYGSSFGNGTQTECADICIGDGFRKNDMYCGGVKQWESNQQSMYTSQSRTFANNILNNPGR